MLLIMKSESTQNIVRKSINKMEKGRHKIIRIMKSELNHNFMIKVLIIRWSIIIIFNWNHFEMRLLNLRINFYLLRTFCPHLGCFYVVSYFTTFRPNFTSSLLQVIYR